MPSRAKKTFDKENLTPELEPLASDSDNEDGRLRFTAQQKGKGKATANVRAPGKATSQSAPMDIDSESEDGSEASVEITQERKRKPRVNEKLYDPDQNVEERRELRKNLRGIHFQAQGMQTNIAETSTKDIGENIDRLEQQFKRIRAPQEAALDSGILVIAAETAAMKARQLRIDKNAFDTDEFVARLKNFLRTSRTGRQQDAEDDDSENEDADVQNKEKRKVEGWHRMGMLAARHTLRIPACDFMLGPLAIQPKKKAERKKSDKKNAGAQPEASQHAKRHEGEVQQLVAGEIAEDNQSTTNMATEVANILKSVTEDVDVHSINFFKFIVNPRSFAQSIENMFYLSFLVRDGIVCLDLETDLAPGEPMIYPCEPPGQNDRDEAEAEGNPIKRRQIMLEMDMQMWKDAIEMYDIKESIIPHREVEARPDHVKW